MGLNFGQWLRRLGFKDGEQPAIVRAVQPVQVVSDVSYLVSPEIPSSGVVGGIRGPVPAVFTAFEIYGGTRGGGVVELDFAAPGGVPNCEITYTTTRATLANLVPLTVQTIQPGTTMAFRLGTEAAGAGAGLPVFRAGTNSTVRLDLYVPPGTYLYAKSSVANVQNNANCIFQEFEAGPAPA